MKFFLPIIFFLGISRTVFGKGIRRERSNNDDGLSYQELKNMNVSCYPFDSCMPARTDDPPVPAFGFKCSCHRQCWEYGTCCIDSPYRFKPPIQKCVNTKYGSYYMVHRCPDNTHSDSIWRNHCESKSDDIFMSTPTDDILMMSPVTSLDTSRTYKNYYCFRCHESTDKYVFWNLEVKGDYDALNGKIVQSVVFNETRMDWVAILEESHVSVPVSVGFLFPSNVQAEPIECEYFNFIAGCLFPKDEGEKAKCLAYSAVVHRKSTSYKNVHCALCDGISPAHLTCNKDASGESGGGGFHLLSGGGSGWVDSVRQFGCIMNFAGGCSEEKAKPATCNEKYEVWSSNEGKCRKVKCLKSGYVRKNDICAPP